MGHNGIIRMVGGVHQKLVKPRQSNRIVEYLVRYLPDGGDILDVGCGTGKIARLVQEANPRLAIKGIDILVQPGAEIEVQAFDGSSMPFPENSFDAVMFVDVLHHTTNHRQLISEAVRVSRGPVVIKDHLCNSSIDHKILAFMDWVGNRSLGIQSIYNYYSKGQWDSLFQEFSGHSVTNIQVKRLYPFPFSLIFNRHMQVMFVLSPGGGRKGSGAVADESGPDE